ncbi:hypothetical protein EDB89DRAFT_1908097 [Lactarius sanguifluus]|nr:hypothetical protein EDB89DRAFT_1908097 [Lactarius sanguifluus]
MSTIPGPLNVQYYVPIMAPNASAAGAGGGPVFVASGVDTSFTAASVPALLNVTAQRNRGSTPSRVIVVVWLVQWQRQWHAQRQGGHGRRHGACGASCWRFDASSGSRSGPHATREQCWFAGSARTEFR